MALLLASGPLSPPSSASVAPWPPLPATEAGLTSFGGWETGHTSQEPAEGHSHQPRWTGAVHSQGRFKNGFISLLSKYL